MQQSAHIFGNIPVSEPAPVPALAHGAIIRHADLSTMEDEDLQFDLESHYRRFRELSRDIDLEVNLYITGGKLAVPLRVLCEEQSALLDIIQAIADERKFRELP